MSILEGPPSSTTVNSGGTEIISSGATLVGATVKSGGLVSGAGALAGILTVSSGGAVFGGSVVSGATDVLWVGGFESGVTVNSGGILELAGLTISSGAPASAFVATFRHDAQRRVSR